MCPRRALAPRARPRRGRPTKPSCAVCAKHVRRLATAYKGARRAAKARRFKRGCRAPPRPEVPVGSQSLGGPGSQLRGLPGWAGGRVGGGGGGGGGGSAAAIGALR